jgi:hypothetical protein
LTPLWSGFWGCDARRRHAVCIPDESSGWISDLEFFREKIDFFHLNQLIEKVRPFKFLGENFQNIENNEQSVWSGQLSYSQTATKIFTNVLMDFKLEVLDKISPKRQQIG